MTARSDRSIIFENRALGPDFYGGSSGIALFLSYLYTFTRREEFRLTARGAIEQALLHFDEISSINRFGFFSGYVGVAYAATKIGTILKDDSLIEKAMDILKTLSLQIEKEHLMDVIDGNAGAIPALLEMYYNVFRDEKVFDLTLFLGNELIFSAIKKSIGWSWGSYSDSFHYNLTGFGHGAAGVGYGLLELFRKTDKKQFRYAAEQAFAYENHWFSRQHGNWADFRSTPNNMYRNVASFSYAKAWCHGAPGIGISRLRAFQILKDDKYLKDCQAALRTTVQIVRENNLIGQESDYSLCHGLAGICELLICTDKVFDDHQYESLVNDVGLHGIEKYMNTQLAWPCGILVGETPDLMLGLAGIGYFYLRLHDSQKIPPAIIVLPP
jgi:lantibiotic biosynthesis protein